MRFVSDWLSWLQEPPTVKQGGGAAPAGWPASGTITYENVTASYRPGLPPVLSNLSFTIQVSQQLPDSATVMTTSMITTGILLMIVKSYYGA